MSLATSVREARTFLFVPGSRPDRFAKAAASGADVVIIDLEDAVAPEEKASARSNVRDWLTAGGDALVRLNAVDTPWHAEDVSALRGVVRAVMLPKAEDAQALTTVAAAFGGCPVVALIETARGVRDCDSLAGSEGVSRFALGNADLGAQLGVRHSSHAALAYARSRLVLASAAAGLPAPIDGVTTAFDTPAILEGDLAHAVEVGFGGKLCIHPSQVATANGAFRPSVDDVSWARRVVAATQDAYGVVTVDGAMIDAPLVQRAERVLSIDARWG